MMSITLSRRLRLAPVALAAALGAAMPLADGAALAAQSTPASSTSRVDLFTPADAGLAGGFVGLLLLARPLDVKLAREIRREPLQNNDLIRRGAAFFRFMGDPGPAIIGTSMYAVGRLSGSERLADLGLHGTQSILVGHVIVGTLKGVFGRARPYADSVNPDPNNYKLFRGFGGSDKYRSFPSGHTLGGFAAAAAVTAETARWWPGSQWYIGPIMYGGATFVGMSRMYENKHWASDVIMGAAIGTFTGLKVVRFHHKVQPGNKLDRWLLGTSMDANGMRLIIAPTR